MEFTRPAAGTPWIVATIAAGLLASPAPIFAQRPAADTVGPRVDAIFARWNQPDSPGCAVGVSSQGQPIYSAAYGSANLEYGVPLTVNSIIETGSVAKQFTAAAVLLLAMDGKLALDDDVRRYVPEVPDFGETITIRHLINHTSGLRDQWGLLTIEGRGPGTQVHSPYTTVDLISRQRALNFPPNTQYLYSNSGYTLLGVIVARVSGQSLQAFSDARIFQPLGMTNTRWRDDHTAIVPNRATAYSPVQGGGFRTNMPFTNITGNGGLLTTVGDLLRWNAALDEARPWGRAFVDSMETQGVLRDGRRISYALGLQVGSHGGVREVAHGGSTAGYNTYLARYPEQRVSVALLCNVAGVNPAGLARQVADLFLEKPTQSATQTASAEDAPARPAGRPPLAEVRFAEYAGTYTSEELDVQLVVAVQDGRLVLRRRPAAIMPMRPESEDVFATPIGELHFSRDAAGRVTGFGINAGRVRDVRFSRSPR